MKKMKLKMIVSLLLMLVLVLPLTLAVAEDDAEEEAEETVEEDDSDEIEDEVADSSSTTSSGSTTTKSKTPAVPASIASVTPVSPYYATVQTKSSDLNVRNHANQSATVLTQLSNGSTLVVTGYTGQWLQVQANGVTGFVPSRYVSDALGPVTQATNTQPAYTQSGYTTNVSGQTGQYYVITCPSEDTVCMRTEPSEEAPVKGVFYYGYQLMVLTESNGWCLVFDEAYNQTGYIQQDQLQQISITAPTDNDQG